MQYLSFQIPIHARYTVNRTLSATAGLNLMAINLDAYSIAIDSRGIGSTGLTTSTDENFPGFQFATEVQVGMNSQLTEKFSLGFFTAASLNSISALNLHFVSHDDQEMHQQFDYNWLRFGLGIIYHFR